LFRQNLNNLLLRFWWCCKQATAEADADATTAAKDAAAVLRFDVKKSESESERTPPPI